MHILLTHLSHRFGEIRGKNEEWKINPERVYMREGMKMSRLTGGAVIKFPQSMGCHKFIYISIFQLSELQESFQQIPHTYIQYTVLALGNNLNTHEVHVNVRHFCGLQK